MNEATTNNVGNRSRANVTLGDRKGRPYAEKKFLYYQANAGQSLRLPGREKQVAATFRLRKKGNSHGIQLLRCWNKFSMTKKRGGSMTDERTMLDERAVLNKRAMLDERAVLSEKGLYYC